jgi:hypothetical protein
MTDMEYTRIIFSKIFGAFLTYFSFLLLACISASIRTKSGRFFPLFNLGFPLSEFNRIEKAVIMVGAALAVGQLVYSFMFN